MGNDPGELLETSVVPGIPAPIAEPTGVNPVSRRVEEPTLAVLLRETISIEYWISVRIVYPYDPAVLDEVEIHTT